MTAPTFDDRARIWPTVIVSVPRGSASWMTLSETWIEYGRSERRRRRDEMLGERGRDRDELERRAGLVDVRHGRVPLVLGRHVREGVRVEPGRGRHRQHRPRVRIEDDRGRALRMPLEDGRAQHVLGLRLDRVVDRQEDVVPVALGHRVEDVDDTADRILDHRLAARAAGQRLVALEFHAGEAVVVDACEADQLRGDRPERVEAALLGIEAEPCQVALPESRSLLRVGLTIDVDEPLRPVGQLPVERTRVDAERLRSGVRHQPRIGRSHAGSRRRSSPARRSRAGRPTGRRSCRARPGPSASRVAGSRPSSPGCSPAPSAATPRARA